MGHDARVMPAKYVKPYVKTNKTDAGDAAAICEAVSRPDMRFVPVKVVEQQAVLVLHRTREILGRQRVMLINALRAHCAEFGIIVPQGARHVPVLVARLGNPSDERLPDIAKQALRVLVEQLEAGRGYTLQGHPILEEWWVSREQYGRPLFYHPPAGPFLFWALQRMFGLSGGGIAQLLSFSVFYWSLMRQLDSIRALIHRIAA